MANSAQAKKRAKQAITRRLRGKDAMSAMRTAVKSVVQAIDEGNKEVATTAYRTASSIIDKMVSKGFIHKNNAARKKKRLNVRVRAL